MALNTEIAFAQSPPDEFRADAERLSNIVLEMQRCFVLHLCKELAPGNVSFPQFFLLAYLDQKEVLTMTAIAQKMGHTTAAASGLVARLENLGYVVRSVAGPGVGTGAADLAWAGRYHIGSPAMISGTPATSPNTSEE